MINMGHCRFRNTLAALRECVEALSHLDGLDPLAKLSDNEQEAARKLLDLCGEISEDYGESEIGMTVDSYHAKE